MDRGDWIQIGANIGALALVIVGAMLWDAWKIRRTARKMLQHEDFSSTGTGLFI